MKKDLVSTLFRLRSRPACWLARTGIALASLAALAVIPGWDAMLGCLGFLGLIGVATLVDEVAIRRTPRT